ncbi:hypothetical protein BDB01DRAFT_776345 [Pilobolus umbonatus]|nr:hypothetical protein BDB01DRAFT_776345 [Pilobolus umbonatus]
MTCIELYSNNFWGMKDEGYHVLTSKMNSMKRTYDEIKSFYSTRASLHEEFGRKLLKHSKIVIGREETSTLHNLLVAAHKEMEWTAQAHLNLAQKLKSRIEIDLDNFILDQKDKRKLIHTSVEKAHRYKQLNESYLSKVKEKYESENAKLVALRAQLTHSSGREADRIKVKIDRIQQDIAVHEQEYKNTCIKLADATAAWKKCWKSACDSYQLMEKKRLEFIHHSIAMYVNVLSSATSDDQESYERIWKSLDEYDVIGDIQSYITEKGTGSYIPESEVFVHYRDDPTKTLPKYTVADFKCPSELISMLNTASDHNMSTTTSTPTKTKITEHIEEDKHKLPYAPKDMMTTQPFPTTTRSSIIKATPVMANTINPLPSVSTPVTQRQKSLHRVLPGTKHPSKQTLSRAKSIQKKVVENNDVTEDIVIDPRAKVVFSIGNNMFDLGNLSSVVPDEKLQMEIDHTSRSTKARDDSSVQAFSYKSLLNELGIFDQNKRDKDNKVTHVKKSVSIRRKQPINEVRNSKEENRYDTWNGVEVHRPVESLYQANQPTPLQPPAQRNQNMPAPAHGHSYFWVYTLHDYYSDNLSELQYTRGTWLAVLSTRPDGWYYAKKFDSRLNTMSNEQGFVSPNYVQAYYQ